MSRKFQRGFNLTLTIIVVALMALVYFWVVRQRPEEEVHVEDTPEEIIVIPETISLIQREEEDVFGVIVTANDTRTYLRPVVDNAGRIQWEYTATPYILAPHLVREKARSAWSLTALQIAHEDTSNLQLADFGFQPPTLTMEAAFRDGSIYTITLGSRTPDNLHYFVMIDDSPTMYLISALTAEIMQLDLADMLDMSLPVMSINDVEYMRIAKRDAPPIVLGLGDTSDAPLLAGFIPEVGSEQLIMHAPISGMFLNHARFMEYVIMPISQLRLQELADLHPEDLSPFGLDYPALHFVFRTPFDEINLKFGDTFTRNGVELIYVKFAERPHVFITRQSHAAALFDVEALQITERSLALVPITDVESVSIYSPQGDFSLVMNHVPNSFDINPTVNGIPMEESPFRRIFRDILNLAADAEIPPTMPASPPEIIIIHHRLENPDIVLHFYDYNANFLAATVDGNEAIFVTNRRAIERLLETLHENQL
ncbi:MAG: DUF4340 domain-containing protein [Defluviitaleaceae bacterium]|nr:DUF4340 domain-containing protein [Defluviitaleaceae bacterium]